MMPLACEPLESRDTPLSLVFHWLRPPVPGVVSFVGVDGVTYTTPSISGSMLSYRIDVAIKRVNDTGTTAVALGDVISDTASQVVTGVVL